MTERRTQVLDAALLVFARYGYRKASMDEVAKAADLSRPGLYLHFASKPDLFRATVEHALAQSIEAARRALADQDRPLRTRLVEAFDHWCGRFVGPLSDEVAPLIHANPDLLASMPATYRKRFLALVADALPAHHRAGVSPADAAATLLSTAAGIKHDVRTRAEFRARMRTAVDLYGAPQ